MKSVSFLCFILLIVLSSGIKSQNNTPIYLEEVEITSSRNEQSVKKAPTIIRVISRKEIESLKYKNISDVLDFEAGVNIESGTGSGLPNRSVVSLNGYPAQYCLILLNGNRLLTEHIHTGQNINLIPLNEIERIEIIKGAGSSQYGSGALGGIINIITKDGTKGPEAIVYANGANYDTYNGGLSVKTRINDRISTYTFADWTQTHGVPLLAPAHRIGKMAYNSLNITERINANFSKKVQADAWVKYVRNRIDWGDGENFSYLFLPNLSLDYQIAKIISIHGKAAYTEWFNETSSERNQLFHPEFWFNLDISQYNHLVIGTDYSSNVFTRTSVNEHTQTANGFFIQDQHKFNSKYTAELGLRIDMVKNLDPVITPRLAILYNPKDHFSLRFGYSRGFRAPTPQDLYEEGYGHGGSALRFGNPDLLPEYSNTISMSAFLLIRERLYVDASAYYSLINNMIVPVYEGPWYEVDSTKDIWRRQNILKANIVSGQVGLKYLVSDNYAIHASYSYSDNFSSTEDSHQLPYNPGQSLNIKITGKQNIRNKLTIHEFVSLRAVTGRTAWNWKPSSEINDASGLITALEDYQKLDAGITFSILNKYDIYLNVSNILGQDIQNLDDALTIIDGEPVYTIGLKLKLN